MYDRTKLEITLRNLGFTLSGTQEDPKPCAVTYRFTAVDRFMRRHTFRVVVADKWCIFYARSRQPGKRYTESPGKIGTWIRHSLRHYGVDAKGGAAHAHDKMGGSAQG